MAANKLCSQCLTANRAGLLFCLVCGRRLPRGAFPPDRVVAVAWPGPEVRALTGTALAGLLAPRAQQDVPTAPGARGGTAVLRLALWLGGVQLFLGLLAGAAMGAFALAALCRAR